MEVFALKFEQTNYLTAQAHCLLRPCLFSHSCQPSICSLRRCNTSPCLQVSGDAFLQCLKLALEAAPNMHQALQERGTALVR